MHTPVCCATVSATSGEGERILFFFEAVLAVLHIGQSDQQG
jgi:hypothetical protein